jgi:hypothetical protein
VTEALHRSRATLRLLLYLAVWLHWRAARGGIAYRGDTALRVGCHAMPLALLLFNRLPVPRAGAAGALLARRRNLPGGPVSGIWAPAALAGVLLR